MINEADTLMGIKCNTNQLSDYIPSIDTLIGKNKPCKYLVKKQYDLYNQKNQISFQAGDLYIENATISIDLLFQDIDLFYTDPLLSLNITVNSSIFEFQTEKLLYEYQIKRFLVLNITYSSKIEGFTLDTDMMIRKFNTEYQSRIYQYLNDIGARNDN
jgi:hypothetical protein